MIPPVLKKYFWDVDLSTVDPVKHRRYVIERLVELGDDQAVRWLLKTYTANEIRDVLRLSRTISVKSRNYWYGLLRP